MPANLHEVGSSDARSVHTDPCLGDFILRAQRTRTRPLCSQPRRPGPIVDRGQIILTTRLTSKAVLANRIDPAFGVRQVRTAIIRPRVLTLQAKKQSPVCGRPK
jgi:hypothetical protein